MGNVEEKKGWAHSFSIYNIMKKKHLTHTQKVMLYWNCILKVMNQGNKN